MQTKAMVDTGSKIGGKESTTLKDSCKY